MTDGDEEKNVEKRRKAAESIEKTSKEGQKKKTRNRTRVMTVVAVACITDALNGSIDAVKTLLGGEQIIVLLPIWWL